MSKHLGGLLTAKQRDFSGFIDRLERVSLNPAIDIRLANEVRERTKSKAELLGLDYQDMTAEELYFALRNRIRIDDASIVEILKLKKRNPKHIAKTLATCVNWASSKEKAFSLSPAGVKKLLKAVPPKKVMKILKIRSLESTLKRYDSRLVYALAKEIEEASWQSQAKAKLKRMHIKDMDWHEIEVIILPDTWYERVKEYITDHGLILPNNETGVVCLLPAIRTISSGTTILALGLLFNAVQELAVHSTPYRGRDLVVGRQQVIHDIASGNATGLKAMHGLTPTWRMVRELMAHGHIEDFVSTDEIVSNSINWDRVESKIAKISPSFSFWDDCSYVGLLDEESGPVSLHYMDLARDELSESDYASRSFSHMQHSLWHELQTRYLQQDLFTRSLSEQLGQFDQDMLL